jgi:hypothetical protein
MNSQKGFINILVIIVVIALVSIGSYFVLNHQASLPSIISTPTPISTPVTTSTYVSTTRPTATTPPPLSVNNVPNARTLYEGYVEIEPISLSAIKTKLKAQGCNISDYKGGITNSCIYREIEVAQFKENGIEIYPDGYGFGPISFYVTENKLLAYKDIPGHPNPDKFKEAVRQDVHNLGDIVKIKENSWKITKMEYPWDVLY